MKLPKIPFFNKGKKSDTALETGAHGQLRNAVIGYFSVDCEAAAAAACPRMAELLAYHEQHQPKSHERPHQLGD